MPGFDLCCFSTSLREVYQHKMLLEIKARLRMWKLIFMLEGIPSYGYDHPLGTNALVKELPSCQLGMPMKRSPNDEVLEVHGLEFRHSYRPLTSNDSVFLVKRSDIY